MVGVKFISTEREPVGIVYTIIREHAVCVDAGCRLNG